MLRSTFVLALCGGLAGCMTAEERQAKVDAMEDAQCRQYGAQPGSQAYYQCRMTLNTQQRTTQRVGDLKAALDQIANPPSGGGINCSSVRTGDVVSTNCR